MARRGGDADSNEPKARRCYLAVDKSLTEEKLSVSLKQIVNPFWAQQPKEQVCTESCQTTMSSNGNSYIVGLTPEDGVSGSSNNAHCLIDEGILDA